MGLGRKRVTPVAREHPDVGIVPEELCSHSGSLRIELGREERDFRCEARHHPGRSDARSGSDLDDA